MGWAVPCAPSHKCVSGAFNIFILITGYFLSHLFCPIWTLCVSFIFMCHFSTSRWKFQRGRGEWQHCAAGYIRIPPATWRSSYTKCQRRSQSSNTIGYVVISHFFLVLSVLACAKCVGIVHTLSIQFALFSIIHILSTLYLCNLVHGASAAVALILLWHFYRCTEFHSLSHFILHSFFSISVVSISHSLGCVYMFFMSFSRLVSWCADIFVVTFIINWFVATNCFVRHGFHRFHSYFLGKKKGKRKKTSMS